MFKLQKLINLLIVVLFIAGLVGCGGAPAATQPPPTQAATEAPKAVEPTAAVAPTEAPADATATPAVAANPLLPGAVKVTIFVGFGTGTDPTQVDVHTAIANEFNASHKDIQVEFLTVPYEERLTKFSTMVAGGETPDLVMPIGGNGVAEFYDEWKDLTPFIEADKYDMTDFFGPTVKLHNYPDKGQIGLPLCVYPTAMYYNVDMFDAAGVDYPPHKVGEKYADGSPWTYEKLIEIGKKLTVDANGNNADSPAFDPENIKQWAYDFSWQDLFNLAPKFGQTRANGVSQDFRTSLLNTQPWVDAFTFWKDVIYTHHITANDVQRGPVEEVAGDPFGSGQIAMWESHTWMSYAYPSWSEAFAWDVAAIPAVGQNPVVANVDADTFTMPKSAKHPEQAWEVVKWLMQPDIYMRLVNNYGCMPARKSLADKWLTGMKEANKGVDFDVFVDSLNYIDDNPNHEAWLPDYTKFHDAVSASVSQMTSGENTDVPSLIQALYTETQKILDDYWAAKQ